MKRYTDKVCSYCGKPYHGLFSSLYCSKECSHTAFLQRLRKRREPFKKKKICVVCGKEFEAGSNGQMTCSEECRKIRYSAHKRTHYEKHPLITKICIVCGKPFETNQPAHKICSDECRAINYKERDRAKYEKIRNSPELLDFEHEKARIRRLRKKQELAQTLQDKPITTVTNHRLKQEFKDTLSIERLSKFSCRCLKCGKEFNLISSEPCELLKRLSSLGRSPCPYCGEEPTGTYCNRISLPVHELQQLYPNFTVSNFRPSWMGGLELDLYDPVSKTALEYHGVTWHCGSNDKGLQKKKADLCESNGVHLIQLYDTEWLQKREIVQDKLDAIFHKNMRRIFARKLKVMVITGDSTIRPFLEKNHIQGYAAHKWAVGLWNGLELVAVCTFKYGTAYASGGQCAGTQKYWELNRYATKLGCSVIGGLSRCVKAFFRTHTEVTEVFSFADRRWTSPVRSAYSSSGFVEVERVAPNYQYTDRNPLHELKNKQQFRKSHIALEHPEIYSDSKTEKQMATELGMFQIWDAGKIKYRISR